MKYAKISRNRFCVWESSLWGMD